MLVIKSSGHQLHNPVSELFEGELIPHPEKPVRAEYILFALEKNNFNIQEVSSNIPNSFLEQVHDRSYIQFLRNFCQSIPDESGRYPSVFPKNVNTHLKNQQALLGFYSLDTYTPLFQNTFQAAYNAASAAYQAAQIVVLESERFVYALCRPSGHHAEQSQMGGYCYLNNAAIAAQYLSQFGKVAILDLDFHHGNGTQQIFYQRSDVLYTSLHADPNWKFPHLSGFSDETGDGEGEGFNQNFPLPQGTDNEQYTKTLKKALNLIKRYQPDFLVVSLGFDTHKEDPICGFGLTTDYYKEMGSLVHQTNIPTVILQEGV